AQAAGYEITWQDFDAVSKVTPLLARIYPNGTEDINAFQRAGGTAFLIRELRRGGLLNEAVTHLMGQGLSAYELRPTLDANKQIVWNETVSQSTLPEVLRAHDAPFNAEGGIKLVQGNLGMGISKISAVDKSRHLIRAPCRIFTDQQQFRQAFDDDELNQDLVVVVRFQGPQANGMPELHQLLPRLNLLQTRGYQVALVTDGRMSGASGNVPSVVHVSPEAKSGGALAKLQDGDLIEIDLAAGTMQTIVPPAQWHARTETPMPSTDQSTIGRNLFSRLRSAAGTSDKGASIFYG
ncbi:MAG: dihydroxy-acid dehydratase, partial [Gammaproteobacteria bacterium]